MTCANNRHQEVYQRDDGLWSIGFDFDDNAAGPFESREFAMSVAGENSPAPKIPFRKINYRRARYAQSSA
jgi:hypothetical protein